MNDDILTEPFLLAEDDDELGCWMAAEVPLTRDLNTLLEDLHGAFGSGFVWTLKQITSHNPMALARNIKSYFEHNANACEVMIFKGNKQISITRKSIDDRKFYKTFIRRYTK